jgi:hypothetical protein
MKTTLQKIQDMVRTANSGSDLLTPNMVNDVMPMVIKAIDNQCKKLNYDGVTYNRPEYEYPIVMYNLLWESVIRKTVLEYLDEKCPLAWFKPMYMDNNEQNKLFKSQALGRSIRDDKKSINIIDITDLKD